MLGYLELSQTSMMEPLPKIVNGYNKKAPSCMFDWVLNTLLFPMSGKNVYELTRRDSQVHLKKVSEILKHGKILKNNYGGVAF